MNFDQYLSILVPLSVFILVFWTKRIILPLCVGIILGAFVVKSSNPLEIPVYIFEKLLSVFYYVDQGKRELNTHAIYIFVFLMILGILPQMFFYSGGIEAFVSWARKKVKDRRSSEFLIFIAGIVIFIDDQFNALTLGRSVRPLGDASKISRERLAYIIDSTSAPVCILIPLSSWGAYIIGILNGSLPQEGSQSALVTLISSIGLNFYAWFALLAVFLTILWRINLPVMHRNVNVGIEKMQEAAPCGRMSSLIFPIVALAFGTLAMIFLTGYLNAKSSDIVTILNKAQTGFSIFFGGVLALVVSFLTSKGKIAEEDYYLIFKQGIKISLPSVVILILAWAIGTIVRDDLQTGIYLSDFAKELLGNKSLVLIPLLLFIASIFIAFMTGTSWGCFAVMIPIGVDLSLSLGGDVSLALAAVLSGAIFGDHTSPISDTTILSSAGTGCSVQSHFITQLPYASIAAFSAFVSLLVLGIFDSVLLAFVVGGGILVGIFYFLKTRYSQELQIV